jgi:hypothetical protein
MNDKNIIIILSNNNNNLIKTKNKKVMRIFIYIITSLSVVVVVFLILNYTNLNTIFFSIFLNRKESLLFFTFKFVKVKINQKSILNFCCYFLFQNFKYHFN